MNKTEVNKTDGIIQSSDSREIKSAIENNTILFSNNVDVTRTVKDELLYFKNDMLKDMKDTLTKFHNKYIKKLNDMDDRLKNTETKTETCYEKIIGITEGVTYQKMNQQRFSELEKFKVKAGESLINLDCKIKNVENNLMEASSKYDKIIIESIIYPGIIGAKNEFKTFHELLDFLLINTKKLLMAKEKENIEKKETKSRIEETLDKFKENIKFCVNKVEELNKFFLEFNEMVKEVEGIKNNLKENKKNENSIFSKLEEHEKIMDNINNEFMNKLKEKTQNIYLALTNEILDINKNMQMIQDKFNEYINEFDSIKNKFNSKNQVFNLCLNDKDKNKLFDLDFPIEDPDKMKIKGESLVKLYINGLLKLSDFYKNNVNNNNENNIKNILSDVEMDLTKNKKKYLKLNIKNRNSLKFDYLKNNESNIRINRSDFFNRKENHKHNIKKEKNDINRLFLFNKVPKIKQYNNLNILNEREEKMKQKFFQSNNLVNSINDIDLINENNIIHSKYSKDRQSEGIKRFLKNSIEEEKKNEDRSSQYKIHDIKDSIEINKDSKNLNIKSNIIKLDLNKRQLSSKNERNINIVNLNYTKENPSPKPKNINNNNNSSLDKSKRLYSSNVIKGNMRYRNMDINFDDTRIVKQREHQNFERSVNQIKDILPYKDRDYFQERVEKMVHFSSKKIK